MPGPFPESWSLCVEEWFYLLLAGACFLLAATRVRPQRALLCTTLVVILLVALYRYYLLGQVATLTWDEWDAQFRCVVSRRLDAPMYGVAGAYLAHYHGAFWKKQRAVKLVLGVGLLCFVNFTFFEHAFASVYMTVFYFPLSSLAVLLMLPFLSEWKTSAGPVSRAVTEVSVLSYSLYLVHGSLLLWTVIEPNIASLPGERATERTLGLLGFWLLSWLVARFLYTCIELPFMKLRSRLNILLPHKRARVTIP